MGVVRVTLHLTHLRKHLDARELASELHVVTEQAGGLGAVSRREGQNEIDDSYVCVFIWSLFS